MPQMRAMTAVLSRSRGRLAFMLLGCASWLLTIWLLSPGFMSRDSAAQILQARTLELNDAHPPLMALVWRLLDSIVEGPLGMLSLHAALHWWGLSALFWFFRGPLWLRCVGLVLVGFYPPLAANLPAIWKDSLMQSALLLAIGCAVAPSRLPRAARLVLAVLLALLAIGARHNAVAAVLPFLVLVLYELPALSRLASWKKLLVAAAGGTTLCLTLTLGLQRAFAPFVKADHFWQTIPTFDLAAMSLDTGELLVLPDSGVMTPGTTLADIRRQFAPEYSAKLYYCARGTGPNCLMLFHRTTDEARLAALARNWREAIIEHPGAYLRHRFTFGLALAGIQGGPPETFYLRGAPYAPIAQQFPPNARALAIMAWIDSHLRDFWFRPALYVVLCVVSMLIGLVQAKSSHTSRLAVAFAVSGLAYFLSTMLAAGTTDYRYTVWTNLCAVLSLVALASNAWERHRAHQGW